MPLLESIEMCINDTTIKHCSEYANFWGKYDKKISVFFGNWLYAITTCEVLL